MPTEITPEQREALRSALIPFVAWGQGTVLADLDAAIDGLLALGWRAPGQATEEEVERAARVLALEDGREWDKPVIREIYRERYEALARAALNAALCPNED